MENHVCDARPVRRQTYGYLPSCRVAPPLDRYQIILLGDGHTRVRNIVRTSCGYLKARRQRVEPGRLKHHGAANHRATPPHGRPAGVRRSIVVAKNLPVRDHCVDRPGNGGKGRERENDGGAPLTRRAHAAPTT